MRSTRFSGDGHVVVGGGSFWGRAISQQLASQGAHVIVIDDDDAAMRETCDLIAAEKGVSTGFHADTGDLDALKDVACRVEDAGVVVKSLTNQYLAMDWENVENCDIAAFERTVIRNLVGPVKASKAFLPALKKAGRGAILHLGSVDGLHGNPRLASYSASKGGIIPLTKVMAHEFALYDIRVNAIASAQTIEIDDTDAAQGVVGFPGSANAYIRQLNAATPLKRYGPLTDWAGAATFLVSEDASYVTGSILVVDCGRLAITHGTA